MHLKKNSRTVMTITIKRYMHIWQKMYSNGESSSRDFGDSSKLINWILDLVATCYMTPQV